MTDNAAQEYLHHVRQYLRHRLFENAQDLADLLDHYRPGITADDIEEWRTNYRRNAPAGDRTGLPVSDEERAAVRVIIRRHADDIALAASYRSLTLRIDRGARYIRDISDRTPTGTQRRTWTLEEDTTLVHFPTETVRDPKRDHERRSNLARNLTAPGPAQAAPRYDKDQEPTTAAVRHHTAAPEFMEKTTPTAPTRPQGATTTGHAYLLRVTLTDTLTIAIPENRPDVAHILGTNGKIIDTINADQAEKIADRLTNARFFMEGY